jgi:hypothetical protein
VAELEEELDRLYGLPLEEFTGERNALAARLRKEGEADAAAEVRGLPKPSLSAWLVNQLARREREGVRRLLDAGEALRRAQAAALRGGSGDELREASAAERRLVRELTGRAGELAAEAGKPASTAMLDRVSTSLAAAAVDEEGRRLLERGRLERDLEQTGFEALGALAAAPAAPEGDELAERRRRREVDRDRVRSLKTEARDLARRAKDAGREAETARRAADAARREAERLEAAAEAAAQRAREEAERAERVAGELEEVEARLRPGRRGRASS